MRSRLAALVTAVFAAAVIAPPDGVVVHRHAGGDHVHLHEHLVSGHHHESTGADEHEHDHDDHAGEHHHHRHDHDHGEDDHAARPWHADDLEHAATLSAAPGSGLAHLHTTPLFHQAVFRPPPALAPPRPLARLAQASPPVGLALARPATRSRGPPVRSL